MNTSDTIFALASGALPSGVAVIRVSGPGVRFGLETLIDSIPEPRRASLRKLRDSKGDVLDRGLVVFFPGPGSFTGEDVAELQVHGGPAVVSAVLRVLGELKGFRLAEAGEFTRRAFGNDRLDLTQVEGLADLVAAETEAQRRQALREAEGAFGAACGRWREALVRARALIEAELDFADEEDVPGSVSDQAWRIVADVRSEIAGHAADRRGERIRDGLEVVVLGPPNAGKSSLVNAIARRDVAIVTPEPGTTRDMIEVRLDLAGVPVTLVDTAGLREAGGLVEREGIRRGAARAERADLVLWLGDVREGQAEPPALSAPIVRVGTHGDLFDSGSEQGRILNAFDVVVSSVTGLGLGDLLDELGRRVVKMTGGEPALVTRERQRSALRDCLSGIDDGLSGNDRPIELRAEDLRRAGDALGRLTGRIGVEDLLDVIFREFCVGK